MDNSLKGMLLAAGVIVTCIVVGIGFYLAREAKNTNVGGIEQINEISSQYQESEWTRYDGLQVSGRDVIDFIKKTVRDGAYLAIEVINKKSEKAEYNYVHTVTGTVHSISSGTVQDIQSVQKLPANTYYINPAGKFTGTVYRDKSRVIVCIRFVQE